MAKTNKTEMSFLEHLEELRWHIIRSVLVIVICAILAFVFSRYIFDYVLLAPRNPWFITNKLLCRLSEMVNFPSLCINSTPFKLVNISMSGQFSTDMKVSMIAGLIVAAPFVFWEFWSFVAPALKPTERRHANGAVIAISGLFFIGVLFGYYIIVPFMVHFLGSYTVSTEVENTINLTSYFSNVASVTLASGAVFELPVIVYFLSRIGVLTPGFLRKYRRHAVVIILIIAAIITPPDVFSQILVSIPLIFLYEIGIIISAQVEKSKKKAINNDGNN